MCLKKVRPESQRFLTPRYRFLHQSLLLQSNGEVVEGFGVI